MKKFTIFFALAVMMFSSCIKDHGCVNCPGNIDIPEKDTTTAVMRINLNFPQGVETKALSAYTTTQPYESVLKTIQVLVFDNNGMLNAYKSIGPSSLNCSLTTNVGQKTIWAILNFRDLSSISSLSELNGVLSSLDNNATNNTGFVWSGSTTCNLSKGGTSATVNVSLLSGRVALSKLTVNLPTAYKSAVIKNIYLINVSASDAIVGTGSAKAPSANVAKNTNSYTSLLLKSVNTTVTNGSSLSIGSVPYLFYAYRNTSSSSPTRLVVEAEIGGKLFYYPITFSSIERSKTYTVGLTITNLGSNDPNVPVEKGTVDMTIKLAPWTPGPVYTETI